MSNLWRLSATEAVDFVVKEQPQTSDLWRLSATEVARLVRARKVSAREVADAALQRLDSVNPRINAIVDCRPDMVRAQADRVDSILAQGAESARGISPRAAHRSGRESLDSSGSCHPKKAAAFHQDKEFIRLPVDSIPMWMACSLCSTGVTPLPHYYGAVRP